jgi:colanic acid biosynthesis glycosyl transferase WcaI
MKILLVTNLFHPDELAGASLYSDMAKYFLEQGHDVRVVCTFSYYPAWKVRKEDEGVTVREEVWEGIPLRRVGMYVPGKPRGLTRLVSDLSFFVSLFLHGFKRTGMLRDWRPDVVVTACPMLSQVLVQRFSFFGVPRLVIVQDFVVDAALELGILKLPLVSGVLEKVLRGVERWALRVGGTITTISPGMLDKLRRIVFKDANPTPAPTPNFKGDDRRLILIPNWIHRGIVDRIRSVHEQHPEISGERLGNVGGTSSSPMGLGYLLYAGNLGIKQGLPDFLEDYFKLASKDWKLRIFGGGAEVARLTDLICGRTDVELGGVLSEEDYVRALLTCTAVLVTQKPGVGANFLPSKLLPALAAGCPVLAVCDLSSPLGREVFEGGFGVVVSPGDPQALEDAFVKFLDPEFSVMASQAALKRAALYSRERILAQYETELRDLISGASVA